MRSLLSCIFGVILLASVVDAREVDVSSGFIRFSTDDDFTAYGGSVGLVTHVAKKVNTYGALSHDADVWSVQGGLFYHIGQPVKGIGLSLRTGVTKPISGPAEKKDVEPTVGASLEYGENTKAVVSFDRASDFSIVKFGFTSFWGDVPFPW